VDRTLDYVIIVVYLIGVALFGIISGGKQKSAKDYFLGTKAVPWWVVCFSIVAAETSALTFISIPGLSYLTNLNFIQLAVGYLIGRIIVARYFLPSYFKGEIDTAYAFLGNRFGIKTRRFSSIIFLLTRIAADGVRLFATAIPLKILLNISYPAAIIIITSVTLVYTLVGGVRGIIWVDMIQMFIYIGAVVIAGAFLIGEFLPNGLDSILESTKAQNKFSVINFGFQGGLKEFFNQPYTLIASLVGGSFLSMASHGTDQLIIQRLLVTRNLKKSQKAIIGSGIIIIIQFMLFLGLGVGLYAYYGVLDLRPDEIFSKFIIENLPVGVTGFIIAGLFAAAMSTLAGSISSLSSSTMLDLFKNYISPNNPKKELLISRILSVMWGILLMLSAFLFMSISQPVIEIALGVASFTFGGLLGTFLLGIFVKKATQEDALAGFVSGIFAMITVVTLNLVAWTWYIFIGVTVTMAVGTLLSSLSKKDIDVR